jgi:hypothetical protein
MSYITIPRHVDITQVTKVNHNFFLIKDQNWYHVLSFSDLSFCWRQKKQELSFDAFVNDITKDSLTKSKVDKEYHYLLFFYHYQYHANHLPIQYTTFINVCYDDYKEIFLLLHELVTIKELFDMVWKILFSVCVTDKSSIKYNVIASFSSIYTTKAKELIHRSFPIYLFKE